METHPVQCNRVKNDEERRSNRLAMADGEIPNGGNTKIRPAGWVATFSSEF